MRPLTTLTKDIDTIILGVGIIGVNTAYWLSRLGQSVNDTLKVKDETYH